MNLKEEKNQEYIKYQNTNDIFEDVSIIIESARDYAYKSVNTTLLKRNWLIGYRIAEEELKGNGRADYGLEIIRNLSKKLTAEYGKGFDKRNLYHFLKFYNTYPKIVYSVSTQSGPILSWTHYRILLQVSEKQAREWYEKEAAEQGWSVRTLQRNIDTQYYYRLLKSQVKEPVIKEMKEKTKQYELMKKLEMIKNPVIAEFLGYSLGNKYSESDLETCIINNLQNFLMEIRKRVRICCKATAYSY